METLPDIHEPNLHHIYNPATRKYDIIDLDTGKTYDPITYTPDPVEYSLQMVDLICARIRAGETLQTICQDREMPTIHRAYAWLALYPEFRVRYEQVRKQRADSFHDRALEIALSMPEKDMVPAAKLAVDTLKWAAEKASPDYYGTKKDVVTSVQPSIIILNTGIDREGAPSIEDLLRKKEPVTIEAEVIKSGE